MKGELFMETNIYERLDKLGLAVPKAPVKGAYIHPARRLEMGLFMCQAVVLLLQETMKR